MLVSIYVGRVTHVCRTVYFLKEIKGVGGVSMIQAMIGLVYGVAL